MKEKSDKSKLREGRGIIDGDSYAAWRRASEAKSMGTSVMLYDPIAKRSVSLLSMAEKKVFWALRFREDVEAIYEQFPLSNTALVDHICQENHIPRYNHILSTDFLVKLRDGSYQAISVKPTRKVFDKNNPKYRSVANRQGVEKAYWNHYNIPWRIAFAEDFDDVVATNIESCTLFWNQGMVRDEPSILKHLIAHHIVTLPMDKPIPFVDVCKEIDVRRIYEDYKQQKTITA